MGIDAQDKKNEGDQVKVVLLRWSGPCPNRSEVTLTDLEQAILQLPMLDSKPDLNVVLHGVLCALISHHGGNHPRRGQLYSRPTGRRPHQALTGFAGIEDATEGDLTFLANPAYESTPV